MVMRWWGLSEMLRSWGTTVEKMDVVLAGPGKYL